MRYFAYFFVLSLWFLLYVLHLPYVSIWTSCILGAQWPHVTKGYCIGQHNNMGDICLPISWGWGHETWPPRLKVNSQNSISQIIPVGIKSFLDCNVRRWQRDLVIWLSFSPHSLPAMPLNDHIISLMYMSFAELANLPRVPEVHIQVRLHGSIYTVYPH